MCCIVFWPLYLIHFFDFQQYQNIDYHAQHTTVSAELMQLFDGEDAKQFVFDRQGIKWLHVGMHDAIQQYMRKCAEKSAEKNNTPCE